MEEAPANGKELLHSAHADGMNECIATFTAPTVMSKLPEYCNTSRISQNT
jgi:hypothetical protein